MSSSGSVEAGPRPRRGLLFVVSAPSGTGKTTLVERLVERTPDLALSCSYTSRAARPGEVDHVDYHFIERARFEAMIGADAFLEWASVFGNYYGTGRAETERLLADGRDVVLVIDVQGARQVRQRWGRSTSVFILPPSFAVLESRLRGRSQDSDQAIARRLTVAREEVRAYTEYDYVVINDELESAVARLGAIVEAERLRREAMRPVAEGIIDTF